MADEAGEVRELTRSELEEMLKNNLRPEEPVRFILVMSEEPDPSLEDGDVLAAQGSIMTIGGKVYIGISPLP